MWQEDREVHNDCFLATEVCLHALHWYRNDVGCWQARSAQEGHELGMHIPWMAPIGAHGGELAQYRVDVVFAQPHSMQQCDLIAE